MNMLFRLLWTWLRAKARGPVPPLGPCTTPFRVLPSDLDILMHVNNGRYLSLMDLGRVDLMMRSGHWAKLRATGWYPVVAAQTIVFARSLTLWQRFTIETRVIGWDEQAIFLEQDFFTSRKGKRTGVARAVVQARFLAKDGARVPAADVLALGDIDPASPPLPGWIVDWAAAKRKTRREF